MIVTLVRSQTTAIAARGDLQGVPRKESGSSVPVLKSCTNPRLARIKLDALINWFPRAGVGSSLRNPAASVSLGVKKKEAVPGATVDILEDEEGVQTEDDRVGVRQITLRPPLFDKGRSRRSILDQSRVKRWAVLDHKVGHGLFSRIVLGRRLLTVYPGSVGKHLAPYDRPVALRLLRPTPHKK